MVCKDVDCMMIDALHGENMDYDAFEILGLPSIATRDEVKDKYNELRKQYLEDRFKPGDEGERAAEKLQELMNLFKEVADIKTADQLHLPTPEVAYHTIATKPTQIQQDMVKALSERASKVHSGAVSPDVDNMLKITSDGRKLGLDQRIINKKKLMPLSKRQQ